MIEPIIPDWPAPASVKALVTTRQGGVSDGCLDSLNLGVHVGDDPERVRQNRERLAEYCAKNMGGNPQPPCWLEQVHGTEVVQASSNFTSPTKADASWSDTPGQVCVVMTADCLPVFFSTHTGDKVAVAHAGWRGLAEGVLEATVATLNSAPSEIIAWLGPAIGSEAFEVGDEVRAAFLNKDAKNSNAFMPSCRENHWLADLYSLARNTLNSVGVDAIYGGDFCTYQQEERFFSYRRDGQTGRMASLIWLADN